MHSHSSSRQLAVPLALALVLLFSLPASAQVFVYPRRPNKSLVHVFDFKWDTVDIHIKPEHEAATAPQLNKPVAPSPPTATEPATPPPPPPSGGPAMPGHPVMPGEAENPQPQRTPHEVPISSEDEEHKVLLPKRAPQPLDWAHAGGVRLYYYQREAKVASYAAASIVKSYRDLAENAFHFVPPRIFPYILYSSYAEYLETNLFPLQEGVLGVTSPLDLKLTLPYLGDDRMFERVSRHEMSHEFTFQKTQTLAKRAHSGGDPSEAMPLWFVEGLAEFYAQGGIDPEAEMLARDLVTNPDLDLGYALLGFYDDRPGSVLWTYKLGQVRCAFLEDTYGKGFIQRVLDNSTQLSGFLGFHSEAAFPHLIQALTGDDPQQVSRKFNEWIKKRMFSEYLQAGQGYTDVRTLNNVAGEPNALAVSPDGNVLLYRTISETTGQSKLVIVDRRDPGNDHEVVRDGVPGVESLHPVFPRNFDLDERSIVYSGESNGYDILYWQSYAHHARALPRNNRIQPQTYDVGIDLQGTRAYPLVKKGIIAAMSPSLSPDGKRVAFIGLTEDGVRDVYVLDPKGDDFSLTQLTHDISTERELTWGPSGIVFTSDNTKDRKFNLFRVQPDQPDKIERLTDEPRDEDGPRVMPDGRIFFAAYDHARHELYELQGTKVIQRTDLVTGTFDPNPGPNGGVWALVLHGGLKRPSLFAAKKLVSLAPKDVDGAPPGPGMLPELPLTGAAPYDAFAPRNWELGTPFAFIGGGTGGIFGQVYATATDKLNNHGLLFNASMYGSVKLTDAILLYVDQTHRTTWGAGLFQGLNFRLDQSIPGHKDLLFTSVERFYGAIGELRYPFNRFFYLQGTAAAGGVSYSLTDDQAEFLFLPELNGTGRDLLHEWYRNNPSPRLQTELSAALGYDTITYGAVGGISGNSLLLEGTVDYQPQPKYQNTFGTLRLDAEHFFPLAGRTHVFVRLGAGTSLGGILAQQFYLSTFDTLRGVHFGDTNWILGREFLYSTAELRIPLNGLIRLFIFNDIEGVLGVDFGGVGNNPSEVWDKRVFDVAVGTNFMLGPIMLRLAFAKPIDIGAPAGVPSVNGDWVTNFSIGYLGFGVFGFGGRPPPAVLNSPHGVL